jgi:hypothetical protein
MAEREYQRLTRSKSRSVFGILAVSRSSLWLAKDHLLVIDTNNYTETYKRFYFRDIQALLIRRTERWKINAVVLGAAAALCGSIGFFGGVQGNVPAVAWIFGGVAGLFLLGLTFNLAAGPTCVCHLRTAVQVELLPSLNRVRGTRKALGRLRPLLAQAQGQLAPEELAARLQALQFQGS